MRSDSTYARVVRDTKRFEVIVRILAKYGLADWLRDWDPGFVKGLLTNTDGKRLVAISREERIRLALTELGTTFIKLGQMLSTRSDIAGPLLAEELSKLQSEATAVPFEAIRATIEEELGKPVEELFSELDPHPLGSASIAQVHRATLSNGEAAVVKVQRSGIEDTIRRDLEILDFLVGIAEKHSAILRLYRPRAVISEFRKTLLRELDFLRERRNLDEFAENFAEDPTVRFPTPYPQLTTERVLTMECLEGIAISDTETLRAAHIDTQAVAWNGATVFLEMTFRDGFYHADPHPGNILVLAGGVVGLLDCGMAGHLDDATREDLENLLQGVMEKDSEEMMRHIVRLGSLPPELERDQLQRDIDDFVAEYGDQSLEDLDLSEALNAIVGIVHTHRIILRPSISLFIRMLLLLEGSARLLSRDFSLTALVRPFVQRRISERLSPSRLMHRMRRVQRDWTRLIDMVPRELSDILYRIQNGTFEVHLHHQRLDTIVNRLVYGILTASLFVGSSMLWSSEVPPLIRGVSVLGALGTAASTGLALRLFRAIALSGGLETRKDS